MYKSFDESGFIKGLGTDIAQISRFEKMTPGRLDRLAHKILNETEYAVFASDKNQPLRLCFFFCCKESVAKALGTGFVGFGFKNIFISKSHLNRPTVHLSGNAADIAQRNQITSIKITVSHEREYVISTAIAC